MLLLNTLNFNPQTSQGGEENSDEKDEAAEKESAPSTPATSTPLSSRVSKDNTDANTGGRKSQRQSPRGGAPPPSQLKSPASGRATRSGGPQQQPEGEYACRDMCTNNKYICTVLSSPALMMHQKSEDHLSTARYLLFLC